MSKPRIYIDGQEGTTGLRIRAMLEARDDVEILLIPDSQRKDPTIRSDFLNSSDLSILCLPDDAAGEALELIQDNNTRIIDTSTIRRIHPDWVYGLPELGPDQRKAIREADKVANIGCYPVGFILAVRPLIEAGFLDRAIPLTVNAVSGYSGGGRKMIEHYQQSQAHLPLQLYSLGKPHKHVPEMQRFGLTDHPPLFVPSVDHSFCGMLVCIPLPASYLPTDRPEDQIHAIWNERYRDSPFVRVGPLGKTSALWPTNTFADQAGANFTNRIDLFASANQNQGVILVGRLDNLGKGAAGNAVQCLNLMLGFDEKTSLAV